MATRTSGVGSLVGGLRPADPFLETYRVRPGGATAIALHPDDRLTVIDRDGAQAAELTVLTPDGAEASTAIGAVADVPATVLRAMLSSTAGGASDLVHDLVARGSVRSRGIYPCPPSRRQSHQCS